MISLEKSPRTTLKLTLRVGLARAPPWSWSPTASPPRSHCERVVRHQRRGTAASIEMLPSASTEQLVIERTKMIANMKSAGRPLTAVIHQMNSEGLIRSYVDGDGHLRWTITELGRTFQALIADHADETPIASRFDVGDGAEVHEIVTPDESGKLVVDVGPAVRSRFKDKDVPEYIELGLLNHVHGELTILEEVTPAHPQRFGMDVGMARTRPRSKITKAEFELVGHPVEFVGIFDREGRLCAYSPLVQWGEGGCRTAKWTVLSVTEHDDEAQ